ncbi:MAG: PilZ domain-containing protein [Acidimicrobiia bacterium]
MHTAWKPAPGQVALIEPEDRPSDCLTGIVIASADSVVIDLGAAPRSLAPQEEVTASFFAPDALYRIRATAQPHDGQQAVVDLDVHDIERVQRRGVPRARVTLHAVMSCFDSEGEGFVSCVGETLDVGPGGCRLLTSERFPSGCDPTVTLHLANGDALSLLAAVLEVKHEDRMWEYRLVFVEGDDADVDRLAELASTHD